MHQRRNRRAAGLYHAHGGTPAPHHPRTLGKGRRFMSQPSRTESQSSPLSLDQLIEQVCGPFEAALKAAPAPGPTPRVEDYLSPAEGAERPALLRDLIL